MGDAAKGFSSEPRPAAGEAGSGAASLRLPRLLGRRLLLKLAARGGMGDVYLAASTGIEGAERPCIVKTVRRDHIHDGSFLARFLDEARVQAQLQHPGVAQVLEAATDEDGEPYTVVEYVEGRSLSDLRQRAIQMGLRVGWPEAVAFAIEIAQALAHVHERSGADGAPLGIVHRDLSPQNVMVGYAGEVKLIDFGTARGHNRRCHTVAGVVFAKPGYVAPEVARQQVGDGRIDLYALGVMLWELASGRRFLATDPQRHLDDAAAGKVVLPPVAAAAGAPTALDEIVSKLTKNDPDERYARASLAVPDLAKLLASAPTAEAGERGVRGRISLLMRRLWPHEPGRTRAEFVRLLRDAREVLEPMGRDRQTPPAGPVTAGIAARMTTTDPAQLAGTPYRLGRKLGEGAAGAVYEAEHLELGRKVALKLLAPEHSGSAASLDRFRREARAVAALGHSNIVQLYDFGRSLDGHVFLAMELCPGETLEARLRKGPLAWEEAVEIAIATARALEAAHAAGLVHRDLKPHNLMLLSGAQSRDRGGRPAVKLLDFGVATALTDPSSRRTVDGKERALRGFAVFGTPEYMAPEQVADEPVDGRADLYSLGCVLYEMLTGERAFDGSSVVVMGKQLRETPAPPRARAPARRIPPAVERVVVRAMAKHPQERFATAAAMREALRDALLAPGRRKERLHRAIGTALTGAAMVAAAMGSAWWARRHETGWEIDFDAPSGAAGPAADRRENTEPAAVAPVLSPAPPPLAAAPSPPAVASLSVTPNPPSPTRDGQHEGHLRQHPDTVRHFRVDLDSPAQPKKELARR